MMRGLRSFPPSGTALIAQLLRHLVDTDWSPAVVVGALWYGGRAPGRFTFKKPRLSDVADMSLDQKASVFEIVVLNGILWPAMRPVEDQYDAQKMQAAAAAVTALREQGQLSRGQEGPDTAMSTLDQWISQPL